MLKNRLLHKQRAGKEVTSMKEHENQEVRTINRRTVLGSGIATGLLGTGFFAIGEGLDHLSQIDKRLQEARTDPESQVPLPGGWTKEKLLERQKIGNDGFKIMGLSLTVAGAIQVFDAALNGNRVLEDQ